MHPVGPLPSRVYWIRRAIAIGAAVIVLVLLAWFVVSKATGGNPTNTGAQTPVVAASSSSGPLTGVLASDPSSDAAGSGAAGSAADSSPVASASKSSAAKGSGAGTATSTPASAAAGSTSTAKNTDATASASKSTESKTAAAGSSKPAAAPAPERTSTPPPATVDTRAEQAAKEQAAKAKAAKDQAAKDKAAKEKAAKAAADNAEAAKAEAAGEQAAKDKAAADAAAAKADKKQAADKAAAQEAAKKAAAEKAAAAKAAAAKAAPTTDAQGRLICQPAAIKLTTTSGAPTYQVGDKPILGLVVTNTSDTACAQDTSGAKQVFTASTAGGERIWSTNDCFPGTGTETRMVQPGESVPFNIKWAGTTSQPNCAGERVEVKPGKYVITAELDGRKAEPVTVTFNG